MDSGGWRQCVGEGRTDDSSADNYHMVMGPAGWGRDGGKRHLERVWRRMNWRGS
jgi:hypothetical protein